MTLPVTAAPTVTAPIAVTAPTTVTATVEDPALVEKRRRQIVAAATDLFAEQGYDRTTIKDIAGKAGVSPGLVYLYVREKEDVLLLVLLGLMDAYAEALPRAMDGAGDPLDRLLRGIRGYCRTVDRHRAATLLAYRATGTLSPARRDLVRQRETQANDILAAAIVAGMKARLVRRLNVDILTGQIVLIAHGWALGGWRIGSRMTLDAYVADNLDILLAGMLTPAGQRRHADLRAGEAAGGSGTAGPEAGAGASGG